MKVELEIVCRGTVTVEVPDEKLAAVEALGSYCDLDDFELATSVTIDLDDLNITEHAEIDQIDILAPKVETPKDESL
jgi:hypothetical protein